HWCRVGTVINHPDVTSDDHLLHAPRGQPPLASGDICVAVKTEPYQPHPQEMPWPFSLKPTKEGTMNGTICNYRVEGARCGISFGTAPRTLRAATRSLGLLSRLDSVHSL